MDELSPRAKALLERAEPEFTPSKAQLDGLHARLRSTPSGSGGGSGESGSGESGATGSRLFLVTTVGVLVLAGVIGLGLVAASKDHPLSRASLPVADETGEGLDDGATAASVGTDAESAGAADIGDSLPLPSVAGPRSPDVRDADPGSAPESTESGHRHAPQEKAPRAEALEESPPPGPPAGGLSDELQMIAGSRLALKTRRFDEALTLARGYRARFPSGSFLDEAAALALLARCARGSDDALEREVQAYLGSEHSQFAPRVRAACVADQVGG